MQIKNEGTNKVAQAFGQMGASLAKINPFVQMANV